LLRSCGELTMADQKSRQLSPASLARADRQRVAQDEAARAMAEVERAAIAVRKNMERLRELRETREAQEKSEQTAATVKTSKKRKLAKSK